MAMYLTPTYILGQNWGKPGKPVKGDIFSRENSLRSNYPKLVFGHLHIYKGILKAIIDTFSSGFPLCVFMQNRFCIT